MQKNDHVLTPKEKICQLVALLSVNQQLTLLVFFLKGIVYFKDELLVKLFKNVQPHSVLKYFKFKCLLQYKDNYIR